MDDPDSRSDAPTGHGQLLHLRKVEMLGAARGSGGDLSASDLFAILWLGLADVLGTAAAATLLRRAAQRAAPATPELAELSITRDRLEYRYVVPAAWHDQARPPRALRELTRELWGFLVDLTGSVVVNRIARIPELRQCGLIPEREQRL